MPRVPTIPFAILACALLVTSFAPAVAQDCWMGIMFDGDDGLVDNIEPTSVTIDAHLVLGTTADAVSGYEAGITISNPQVFVLGVTTPPGWANFGSVLDQVVGFSPPLPAGGQVILCTLHLLLGDGAGAELCVVAPSFLDGDGNLHACEGRCGYITSPVRAHARAFGAVKALFD